MQTDGCIIGIDEAGRGPLAGPVYVAAVSYDKKHTTYLARLFRPICGKDSKKLTPQEREMWFGTIMQLQQQRKVRVAQSGVGVGIIDSKGIVAAIKKGVYASLYKLKSNPDMCFVLLDGALSAPQKFLHQQTIIKGDEKELAIQMASIVAKVSRDRKMVRLAKRCPGYGFEVHKGYGTKMHKEAIETYGLCREHRKSYCHASR